MTLNDNVRVWGFLFCRHRKPQKLMTELCKVIFLKISLAAGVGVDVYSSDKTVFF